MVGIYLSGTGNTKYCIEKLVSLIHSSAKAIPMESPEAISAIQQNEEIYIGYPTQFSNAPYMVIKLTFQKWMPLLLIHIRMATIRSLKELARHLKMAFS